MRFNRQHRTLLSSWWWRIDRYMLFLVAVMMGLGMLLVTTGSTYVADRIGLDSFYFIKRQSLFLFISLLVIMATSMLSPRHIRRISLVGLIVGYGLLGIIYVTGDVINGATRWLFLFGFSLQPSELMKPLFIVITAWMLAEANARPGFKGFELSTAGYTMFALLLILQPDIGMAVVVSAVWAVQLFLAGLSSLYIAIIIVLLVLGILMAYVLLATYAALPPY